MPTVPRFARKGGFRAVWLSLAAVLALAIGTASAAVRVSEFLAENDGGLRDADGDSPDWIELHNDGSDAVNLSGWHLTDSTNDLTRWTFPATNLPGGGYLVVFASGKDRAVAGAELHTNFRLDNAGGFLALVSPDGITLADAHRYPAQRANVSYGAERAVTVVPLVAAGAIARVHVPTDGALGGDWLEPAFDDTGWPAAATGVGFDGGATAAGELWIDFNDDDTGETGAANTEAGFNTMTLSANPATFNGVTVTLSALGGAVLDDRDRAVPADAPPALTQDQLYDDFIFAFGQTNGNGLRLRFAGLSPGQTYALTVWSYDRSSTGNRVSDWVETASGVTRPIVTGYTFDGNTVPTGDGQHTFTGLVQASAAGTLQIEGRRSGGTSHGVFLNALKLVPIRYGSVIATDLGAVMSHRSASVYLRLPLVVEDPAAFQSLRLRVKYDDGFAAYLNGRMVVSRQAPEVLQWNSAATAPHGGLAALAFEEFVLPDAPSLLRPGVNVLALHRLNVAADDATFLLLPEVEGVSVATSQGRYLQPPTPGAANGAGFTGLVADTKFSVNRGFHDAPITVAITTETPGAEIRWTTNGSRPSLSNGVVYTAPLVLSNTTILRAAAFKAGLVPSGVDTHTYLFLDQVLRQSATPPGYPATWQANYPADYGMDTNIVHHPVYGPTLVNDLRSIPTLSLVSDHNGLWSATTGIYPNATSSGPAWEREGSLELIDGSGRSEFAVTARIEMHGNASRDNVRTPKHSLHAVFNADYGPAKLRYDWFGGGVTA
ncbi:MAG TPA: lamin tail domain-containing protein, partial [Methylomirabilota bacterium]|nr:lamin tail domain-containing protein [Methylomirabilota bacterium]